MSSPAPNEDDLSADFTPPGSCESPEACAISIKAMSSLSAICAFTKFPTGPATSHSIALKPALRIASRDPSPPSPIAIFTISHVGITESIPAAIHDAISLEVALPLNESGAMTIFMYAS